MQFAGLTPPPAIIILFVTFFPLQGTFNLLVYMFPRINRYFEKRSLSASATASMTSLTGAKSFFSSLRQSNMEKRRGQRKGTDKVLTTATSVIVESEIRKSTIVSSTENAEPVEGELNDNEEGEEANGGESSENGDDAIDELANIVEA